MDDYSLVTCPKCNGTGKSFCPKCGYEHVSGGTSVIRDRGPLGGWERCPACEGWGYDKHGECSACRGQRKLPPNVARQITKHVPKSTR